jgi:hypothetical protein
VSRLGPFVATLVLLAAGPVLLAQEAVAPPDKTAAFLESLQGLDKTLLGAYRFGLYLRGSKNMGSSSFVVARASEESGAVYEVTATIAMAFGPVKNIGDYVLLLNEKLGIVSKVFNKREQKGDQVETKVGTIRSDGDRWIREQVVKLGSDEKGTESEASLTYGGLNYWDLACVFLVARKLDRSVAGAWNLEGVTWPDGAETGKVSRIAFSVTGATTTIDHRGRQVEVRTVQVVREGKDTTLMQLQADGTVLTLGPVGPPILFVAGTEEEAKADIGDTGQAAGAGAETPKEAVMTYFRALAKTEPIERLDDVLDWDAIREEMAAEKPEAGALTSKIIADMIKEQLASRPAAFPPETLEVLEAGLVVEAEGDAATVGVATKPDKFKLVKGADGRWRITHFPH